MNPFKEYIAEEISRVLPRIKINDCMIELESKGLLNHKNKDYEAIWKVLETHKKGTK